MEILQDKAIMLRVRNPKQLTTIIPNSKEISDNRVVVKWGIDEVHALTHYETVQLARPVHAVRPPERDRVVLYAAQEVLLLQRTRHG